MENPRHAERSRIHRRRTKSPGTERHEASGSHRHAHSHTPRLTRLYMSVPGNRGSDDRILVGGAIAALLILVVIGGWYMLNSPRNERVSSAEHAQTEAVRFVGMTESNSTAEVRFEEKGREFTLSLSSANPLVTELRKTRPGATILVPRSQVPLTEDDGERRKKRPASRSR